MTYNDTSTPPFRADHVGSLLRPERLLIARDRFASGDISSIDLREIEDECISESIKKQEDCGLKAVTDGELRRTTWHYDFLCALEGIDQSAPPQGPNFKAGHNINSLAVSKKVKNLNGIMIDHFRYCLLYTSPSPRD